AARDPGALRRSEDLASGLLFRVDALERRLVEARDGVPNVLLVVDREVLSTFLVDVGEVLARDVLASVVCELFDLRLPLIRAFAAGDLALAAGLVGRSRRLSDGRELSF